ncbi:hypothetical protein J4Q44_G00300440, partial [Coregonus suidteri]
LEALTTGSSLRRPSSDLEYFFRSNTSSSFSEVSNTKTRADHCAGDSLSSERLPVLRYLWISSTRERSFSSFRQWNRLMHLSGEGFSLIFSLMYLTVLYGSVSCFFSLSVDLVSASDWTPVRGPEGSGGKGPGFPSHF